MCEYIRRVDSSLSCQNIPTLIHMAKEDGKRPEIGIACSAGQGGSQRRVRIGAGTAWISGLKNVTNLTRFGRLVETRRVTVAL